MRHLAALALAAFLCSAAGPALAIGLGDLKKKAEKKLKEKVEKKEDEAADAAANAAEESAKDAIGTKKERSGAKRDGAPRDGQSGADAKGGAGVSEPPKRSGAVASVSPKFDFIPGDRTLAAADFTAMKPGPAPPAWKPRRGAAAVEEIAGARWLVANGDPTIVRLPLDQPLPMKWTLEVDYALDTPDGGSLLLEAQNAAGVACWSVSWPRSGAAVVVEGGGAQVSGGDAGSAVGRHRIAFAGNGAGLRVYLDRERVAAAPSLFTGEPPTTLVLTLSGSANRPRLAGARLASGPASIKSRLAGGSLATYGVRFDPASDEVRPESAPVLREVASYLEANGAVKLSIQARADDVADAKRRADRAKKRAAAVRDVLVAQFGVPPSSLVVGAGNVPAEGGAKVSRDPIGPGVVFSKL